MNSKRTLIVGNKKICEQIAYVYDIKEYKHKEKLEENIEKYDNYNIIVCDKKTKRIKKENITYIEQLYKQLDKMYLEKLKPSKKLKHKENKMDRCFLFLMDIIYTIRPAIRNKTIINKISVFLLKPSEILIKVINSKPTNIKCNNIERVCNINHCGNMYGCCPTWVKIPFGNSLEEDPKKAYNDHISRVIKLSSLNKSFCLCRFDLCKHNAKVIEEEKMKELKTRNYPELLTISIDRTCNLQCKSCRSCYINADEKQRQKVDEMANKIIQTGWLNKSQIEIAGNGEVFYSKAYKKLLESEINTETIDIWSNGTLFNEKNWELIKGKFRKIRVHISIDATTKETYKKLRGGDFEKLLKNLEMLGNLRKEGKIEYFKFNYVVQKDNYKEMKDFVKLAKKLNVDNVLFLKLNNWGTFSKKEYIEKSMLNKDGCLDYDMYLTLQDKIFKEKIVDISNFEKYIEISKKYYQNKMA